MSFQIGDRVVWPNAPGPSEYDVRDLRGVVGVVSFRNNTCMVVLFPNNDYRQPFADCELVSEELYNSPLYQALL